VPPTAEIFHDSASREKYQSKRRWQRPHRLLCSTVPLLCGDQMAFFRRPQDGQWRLGGHSEGRGVSLVPADVSDGGDGGRHLWASFSSTARQFVSELPVDRQCVILTLAPYTGTRRAEAAAIAQAIGSELLEPRLHGLRTFDGSHLDSESAERWSAAFFEAAGSRLRACNAVTSRVRTLDAS
jgi:hypothetical protein